MKRYLGETKLDSLEETPFAGFGPKEWVMHYIERYGHIDGEHHKQWLIDQIARILHETPVIVTLAKWDNGFDFHDPRSIGHVEYRFMLAKKPSKAYKQWRKSIQFDDDGEEYGYDEGIAP